MLSPEGMSSRLEKLVLAEGLPGAHGHDGFVQGDAGLQVGDVGGGDRVDGTR